MRLQKAWAGLEEGHEVNVYTSCSKKDAKLQNTVEIHN
jgi:hypothetical protein